MDDFFVKSILYDVYGELLTGQKKTVYEYHILDDLSFAEIGDELGLTRQACHELYKKADQELKRYEDILHFHKRFTEIEKISNQISNKTNDDNIKNLSNKIKKLCNFNKEEY